MNNYNSYKLRKFLEKALDKTLDFVFYIPRKLYKENKSFKDWIDSRRNKRYIKQMIMKSMDGIFYYLDRNEDGICDVALFSNYDGGSICDINDCSDFNFLLENDEWAKKNNLKFEKMTYEEYINKYYPKHAYKLNSYIWMSYKDYIVFRISRT